MKNIKCKVGFIVLLFFCINSPFLGQNNNDKDFYQIPTPNSPAVKELLQYSEYPVNLSAGLVNIEIPLYEVVCRDIIIPIKLTYHASGFRPYDNPEQRIGMGWHLSPDYAISRQISGNADNQSISGFLKTKQPIPQNIDQSYIQMLLFDGVGEEQPDIFSYNLLST